MKQQNECTYCGYVYETDSMYLVNGKYYCSDCVGICDNCGSAELYDDLTVVNYNRDDTRYICSDCLNSSAFSNAMTVTNTMLITGITAAI